MAKPELGTKRVCPVTGRKFYDLNKDPIVSPYTGQAYPRAMFEPQAKAAAAVAAKPAEDEDEVEVADGAVELVSLEDADAEASEKDVVVTSEDDIEVEDDIVADDDDDTFLEEDEEGDDDVSDLIDGDIEGDEDN
ncbi:uncharacterized protein (TIGR02300 family) [Bosea sp. OAE752]|uniref:TIGR02300 family protein n=1 Tax=Bosea spartocytisi TaxID=2773451 RepID=A0A927E8L2_9HYPH|nr:MULTISPECIES: TIGR02300 family protein [Bosea]MBD3845345.1 TIGR02300 family protein [Bosea spartocytisi]MCT4472515.1 TIGR02300 family protein [Bosea spartocytisi]